MAMERDNAVKQQPMNIDIYYLLRCLKKNIYMIFLCSIIAGVCAFIVTDTFVKDTYSSNIHLAVVTRGGNSTNLSERSVSTAVSRNVSVLNSDSLWTQMNKNVEDLKGNIKAAQVSNTNLITLTANSSTAYDSIRLLKVALDTYPALSGYFGSGYYLQKMDSISASRIKVNHRSPLQIGILAVLAVWAVGIGLIGVYTMYSDRIYSISQAEKNVDIMFLSALHYVNKKRGQRSILINDAQTDIAYFEEVDKVVTSIQNKMDKNNYKVLMVNSIYENEGKTTISANIAMGLVRRGKRVVLIDGDLRRPAVAKILDFDKEGKKGLSDYLEGEAALNDILVKNTGAYNLYHIIQTKSVRNAERYLAGENFQKLLQTLGRVADYIIIDTSPVGVVQDAEILAAIVDAAILVVRQDIVSAPEVNDVVDVFEEAGAAMLGGVLNMVKGEKTSSTGRGRYGSYYYGYGYENTER